MIECDECKAAFWTPEGLQEHKEKYCIGYYPGES